MDLPYQPTRLKNALASIVLGVLYFSYVHLNSVSWFHRILRAARLVFSLKFGEHNDQL